MVCSQEHEIYSAKALNLGNPCSENQKILNLFMCVAAIKTNPNYCSSLDDFFEKEMNCSENSCSILCKTNQGESEYFAHRIQISLLPNLKCEMKSICEENGVTSLQENFKTPFPVVSTFSPTPLPSVAFIQTQYPSRLPTKSPTDVQNFTPVPSKSPVVLNIGETSAPISIGGPPGRGSDQKQPLTSAETAVVGLAVGCLFVVTALILVKSLRAVLKNKPPEEKSVDTENELEANVQPKEGTVRGRIITGWAAVDMDEISM